MLPPVQVIEQGKSVNFTCIAHDFLDWRWSLNDGPLKQNTEVIVSHDTPYSTIGITEANFENGGVYKCLGITGGGLNTNAEGELVVVGE